MKFWRWFSAPDWPDDTIAWAPEIGYYDTAQDTTEEN